MDNEVELLSGRSPCIVIDPSLSQVTNAGYDLIDSFDEKTATPTESPDSDTFKYVQVTETSGKVYIFSVVPLAVLRIQIAQMIRVAFFRNVALIRMVKHENG